MPKTLSPKAARASQRRWAEIVYLLELTLRRDRFGPSPAGFFDPAFFDLGFFEAGPLTLRLSDRVRDELGKEWLALVESWGDLGDALAPVEPDAEVGAFDLTLDNTRPVGGRARFSDLVRHGENTAGFDLAFADATFKIVFKGDAAGDEVVLFGLLAEELTGLTEETVTLKMTGRELGLEARDPFYRISTADFPSADQAAVNQPVPIPIGILLGVPGLGVAVGAVDVLRDEMTATDPPTGGTLLLSDPAVVARFPASGTVQIDGELIAYTGRRVDFAELTGITRGAEATTRAPHARGAAAQEVRQSYVYVFGENRGSHKVKALSNVELDGVQLPPTLYILNLDDTGLVAGLSFVSLTLPRAAIIELIRDFAPAPPRLPKEDQEALGALKDLLDALADPSRPVTDPNQPVDPNPPVPDPNQPVTVKGVVKRLKEGEERLKGLAATVQKLVEGDALTSGGGGAAMKTVLKKFEETLKVFCSDSGVFNEKFEEMLESELDPVVDALETAILNPVLQGVFAAEETVTLPASSGLPMTLTTTGLLTVLFPSLPAPPLGEVLKVTRRTVKVVVRPLIFDLAGAPTLQFDIGLTRKTFDLVAPVAGLTPNSEFTFTFDYDSLLEIADSLIVTLSGGGIVSPRVAVMSADQIIRRKPVIGDTLDPQDKTDLKKPLTAEERKALKEPLKRWLRVKVPAKLCP